MYMFLNTKLRKNVTLLTTFILEQSCKLEILHWTHPPAKNTKNEALKSKRVSGVGGLHIQ